MTRTTRLLCALLLSLLVVPAAARAEVSGGVTIPPFYDPPSQLPATNGALVRSEPLDLGLRIDLPGKHGPLPATATRIMYRSTDNAGKPVAVTGTYLEPYAKRGKGPRPLVTLSEGTQGQGDQCAPSIGLERPLQLTPSTLHVAYEIPSVYGFLAQGIAVVVTDYVGLGTTDRVHTYVDRLDQGHAVLDAARAARRVKGASVTSASKIATFGYSQGGGASASAAELAPSYAPELKLVAGYAGAPPADLDAVLKGIDGTTLTGAIGWSLNGFVQSHPELRPILDANLNETGRKAVEALKQKCVVDAILGYGFQHTTSFTTSGRSVGEIVDSTPAIKRVVNEQRIGRLKPKAAMRVVSGTLDDIVDHRQARQLAVDWCDQGANVTYEPLYQAVPTYGTLVNHIGGFLGDAVTANQWVVNRLDGKPASSNCGRLSSLP